MSGLEGPLEEEMGEAIEAHKSKELERRKRRRTRETRSKTM